MTEPSIELTRWSGPWPDDDPDANFKADVALYSMLDPLETIGALSKGTGIPVGAIVRYVLARWASAGSEALLSAGPSVVERMWTQFTEAEEAGIRRSTTRRLRGRSTDGVLAPLPARHLTRRTGRP